MAYQVKKLTVFTVITIFICLLSDTSASTDTDLFEEDDVINVTISTSTSDVMRNNDFTFNCSSSGDGDHHTITVLIDNSINTTNQMMDRLSITSIGSTTLITFTDVIPSDNGTQFSCVAINITNNKTIGISDTLILQVLSAPVFNVTTNLTKPLFIQTTTSLNASCAYYSNPPPTADLVFTNDSSNTANVKFANDMIMFSKAVVDNRGNYTCTVTNALGLSYLTYQTFVGGPPNDISIQLMSTTMNVSNLMLSAEISDNSNAPAQAVMISIPGLTDFSGDDDGVTIVIIFDEIGLDLPVHSTVELLVVNSSELYAGNYSVSVTAINVLGNMSADTSMVAIEGTRPLEVDFSPVFDVTEGMDFAFNCSIDVAYYNITGIEFTFTVLIDNDTSTGKYKRLKPGMAQPDFQEFVFQNTSYKDNGTVFKCIASGMYQSEERAMAVLYAPKVLSPVSVPTKYLNDSSFTISVPYTANPKLSLVEWRRNGVRIEDKFDNIIPQFNNLTFLSVLPTDNGSYSATLYNKIGKATVNFDMMVYYAPIISFPSKYGAFFNESLTVNVSVMANPRGSISWMRNGKPFKPDNKSVTVDGGLLKFAPFSKSDIGNYTIIVANSVGTRNQTIDLVGYNGPYFFEGPSNSSVLREFKTGTDFNITCSIKSSEPPVEYLTITPEEGPNWSMVTDNTTSATLVFHNGNPLNNTRMFKCTATTRKTTAVLRFDNYVGGPPNDISVQLMTTTNGSSLLLSAMISDNSDVPGLGVMISIPGLTDFIKDGDDSDVITVVFNEIPIHSTVKLLVLNSGKLYAGNYSISVTAFNYLGNTSANTSMLAIEGTRPLEVDFSPVFNVTAGMDFAFNCSIDVVNYNITGIEFMFTVLIDNNTSSGKYKRLKPRMAQPGFQEYVFQNTSYKDNGTMFTCIANGMYRSKDRAMAVLYAPIISFPNKYSAFFNESLTVNVSVMANPRGSISWLRNGKPFKSDNKRITVDGNLLKFTPFSKSDIGNYTIIVANSVGTRNQTINLVGYDGPYFVEGPPNSSVLREFKTGTDFNITCSIKSSEPPVEYLTITPKEGPNWSMVTDNTTSATLIFRNGNPSNNTRMFNCTATTRKTTAVLRFDNYVGGPPKNVKVVFDKTDKSDTVIISLKITDNSAVPATKILYYSEGITNKNISLKIKDTPLKGGSVTFDKVISASYTELGAGTAHSIKVYAVNDVGTAFADDYTFTIPYGPTTPSKPKKSKAGAIAAGIIVPLAVISLIVVGVAAFFYYRRRKARRGFTLLADTDDSPSGGNINSSGYRTDKLVT